MSRPKTLQFCCPGVIFANSVVELMIDASLKEQNKYYEKNDKNMQLVYCQDNAQSNMIRNFKAL
jgi:galactose-1-phosphate uridylyltransferase